MYNSLTELNNSQLRDILIKNWEVNHAFLTFVDLIPNEEIGFYLIDFIESELSSEEIADILSEVI